MDWDKIRIFHAVAEAGSFTKAGDVLGLSQSAVSRQISSLENETNATLFHRHARGLILTEQGEVLFKTAHDVVGKLALAEATLKDSKEAPKGELTITTPVGIGSTWLAPRMKEFIDRYPQIKVSIVVSDRELDLSMREADVAIRLRKPTQSDLIQRKLITVHHHIYATHDYLNSHGSPKSAQELRDHKIILYGERSELLNVAPLNWLEWLEMPEGEKRESILCINNIYGVMRAVESGLGIAVLPDYLGATNNKLVRVAPEAEGPSYDTYFVYPEEMRNSKRINVFRDFLISKVNETNF